MTARVSSAVWRPQLMQPTNVAEWHQTMLDPARRHLPTGALTNLASAVALSSALDLPGCPAMARPPPRWRCVARHDHEGDVVQLQSVPRWLRSKTGYTAGSMFTLTVRPLWTDETAPALARLDEDVHSMEAIVSSAAHVTDAEVRWGDQIWFVREIVDGEEGVRWYAFASRGRLKLTVVANARREHVDVMRRVLASIRVPD
jgi:hypothetical protein